MKEEKKELISFIERKIKELKKELSYYEKILDLLTGRTSRKGSKEEAPSKIKVITKGNEVIANLIYTSTGLRIAFSNPVPEDLPALHSFLLKVLEEKKKEGEIVDFSVKGGKGFVSEIEIAGDVKDMLVTELELAITYVKEEANKFEKTSA
jgi:hypothetical protein